jgi:YidC/Oxa1 family membrane protein insertase
MEKRVLLAALISGAIVIVWFLLFPAPRTAPRHATTAAPTVTAAIPVTGAGSTPVVAATGPAPAAARGAAAMELKLEGAGWRVVVDTLGGVLRSVVLLAYTDAAGKPLELVREGGVPPLQMAAVGPWNEEPYAITQRADDIWLRWSDGRGNWVEKRLGVGKGKYALAVDVRAGGAAAVDGVVVASGLASTAKQDTRTQLAGSEAVVRVNGKLTRVSPAKLPSPQRVSGAIEFAGVQDQYFLLALLPEGSLEAVSASAAAGVQGPVAQVAALGSEGIVRGTLYLGAKEHATLAAYGRGMEETISFGIFSFLSVGFLVALRWIYGWAQNWGLAIVVLTAAIRVLLFPLNHKSAVAMKRMQTLQPKIKAIQGRYQERAKKDPKSRERMNQETMELYRKEGVNPMGGCLPMLIQLPILWALYSLFSVAIELRHAPFMLWIKDLSLKDPTYITPILMTATMVAQQLLSPQVGDPAQRRMFMLMPFIFGFMFINFPAGLVLYWLVNNVLTIAQQMLTQRMMDGTKPAQ